MTDRNHNLPTPAEEDPVVHRFLGALPRFQPAAALDTRVLTRVWRPVPPALTDRWHRIVRSWRLTALIALLAAGAFVWQAALAGVALQHPEEVRTVLAAVTGDAVPVFWSLGLDATGRLLEPAARWGGDLVADRRPLVPAAIVLLVFCAGGLYWVARPGGQSHASP